MRQEEATAARQVHIINEHEAYKGNEYAGRDMLMITDRASLRGHQCGSKHTSKF